MKFKFCGGCNPLYNRVSVYEKMKGENINVDMILLNGCHRGCRKILNSDVNYINVQEFFIIHSSQYWKEEEIIKWILEKNKR